MSLRELIYRLFAELAKRSPPAQEDMSAFVRLYAEAISQGKFVKQADHFTVEWKLDEKLDALLCPIIYSSGHTSMGAEILAQYRYIRD